jgi:hypothetical protein
MPPRTMYHCAPFVMPSGKLPHSDTPACIVAWFDA